ncbi:MAG: hypothetical protein OYL41_06200 [Acidobacteriota bacterium]|nr:hypothetical protein [Acidobacteriota bacterium]
MLWRGGAALPFEPLPLAPLPEHLADAGSPHGACLAQRRTAVVATHVTLADQAACGTAEALRLPNLGERVHEAVSALGVPRIAAPVRIEDLPAAEDLAGRRLHPPAGGLVAFPQGSLAPKARAGNDPPPWDNRRHKRRVPGL